MDIIVWVDGDEILRTRSTEKARAAYRSALQQYAKDTGSTGRDFVKGHLSTFDEGAKALGCFGVGVGEPTGARSVEATFHR